MTPLRIGILGAARIAPLAVVRPAIRSRRARVVAVAARDPERAHRFAAKFGVPKALAGYQALLEDPDVDVVYNPLPNGLHAEWTLAAISAGKHVICEKPFTANASEAEDVARAARGTSLVVMEAFHYRYHPFARRVAQLLADGGIGRVNRVDAAMGFPLPLFSDIRYQFDLAGGAAMDAGCYAVHIARMLAGEEPEVVSSKAKLLSPQVDRAMTAALAFPSGTTGKVTATLWSSSVVRIASKAWGDRGRLIMFNPIAPQFPHFLAVQKDGRWRVERFTRRHTYDFQLDAFCAAVLDGEPLITPPADAVANMKVLDAMYSAAGLQLRGTAPRGQAG